MSKPKCQIAKLSGISSRLSANIRIQEVEDRRIEEIGFGFWHLAF